MKKNKFFSLEGLDVDEAIQQVRESRSDDIDGLQSSIELKKALTESDVGLSQSEDEVEAETATVQSNDVLDVAVEALIGLEKIVDIIGRSQDTGGLNDKSLQFTSYCVETICNNAGIPFKSTKLSLEHDSSIRTRLSISTEFMEELKTLASKIWKAIVEQFRRIHKFLRDLYNSRDIEVKKKLDQYKRFKELYQQSLEEMQDKPNVDSVQSSLYPNGLLINVAENKVSDIVKDGKAMLQTMKSFFDLYSIGNTNTEFDNSAKRVDEVLKDISSIFREAATVAAHGTHIDNEQLYMKMMQGDYMVEVKTPSSFTLLDKNVLAPGKEVSKYCELPGGYCFTATRNDFNGVSSIVSNSLKVERNLSLQQNGSEIFIPSKSEFDSIFEICDKSFDMLAEIQLALKDMEKKLHGFCDKLDRLTSVVNKIPQDSNNQGVHKNAMHFKVLSTCLNNYYIGLFTSLNIYLNNYTNRLFNYLSLSLKQYV